MGLCALAVHRNSRAEEKYANGGDNPKYLLLLLQMIVAYSVRLCQEGGIIVDKEHQISGSLSARKPTSFLFLSSQSLRPRDRRLLRTVIGWTFLRGAAEAQAFSRL